MNAAKTSKTIERSITSATRRLAAFLLTVGISYGIYVLLLLFYPQIGPSLTLTISNGMTTPILVLFAVHTLVRGYIIPNRNEERVSYWIGLFIFTVIVVACLVLLRLWVTGVI